MQDTQIIKEIAEMRWEMKSLVSAISKIESILEKQAWLIERQNTANKRILKLEDTQKEHREKIVNLEKWQIKVVTTASIVGGILWSIFTFIISNFL
jgi:vacuolar-type H+-ATPase subunit I/STV1